MTPTLQVNMNKNTTTLSTLNTRTGVKKTKTVQSYSSYWLDYNDVDFSTPTRRSDKSMNAGEKIEISTERMVKFASVRRAIANFVRILTNDEKIKVMFSSGTQSYTDGNTVVISADDNPEKFDSMVGLALHEGSHCILTDFNFLKAVMNKNDIFSFIIALKPELRDLLHKSYHDDADLDIIRKQVFNMQQHISTIMNIIEDRRIDSYVYKNAIGYRPYYDAMYKQYFYNKEVTRNLKKNRNWRQPTVDNYINWILHIFHENFDKNALPGLSELVDIIDLPNIRRFDADQKMPTTPREWQFSKIDAPWRTYIKKMYATGGIPQTELNTLTNRYKDVPYIFDYEQLPLLWRTANDIFYKILQYVTSYESCASGEKKEKIIINGIEFDTSGLPNLDSDLGNINIPEGMVSDIKDASALKTIDKIKELMNGKVTRKKLSSKEERDIRNMEHANASITDGGDSVIGKYPCLVLRKVDKNIMESGVFPFASLRYSADNTGVLDYADTKPILAGIRMGQILAHRLSIRNDPQVTHFTRQPQGKIDRRILAQLGMDIEQVFKRTTIENYKPVILHLSLDASGSMSGDKWERAISVATALAYVSSKIRNIEVVITIRGDSDMPVIGVIYDSRVDRFQKVRNLFPYLRATGSTPEGLCFKAMLDLITECTKEYDVYFINFSDGEPGTYYTTSSGHNRHYGGESAYEHTRRTVNLMREAGVKVLSYFIGYSKHKSVAFSRMYGDDAVFVDVRSVTDVLRTLNKLLLSK